MKGEGMLREPVRAWLEGRGLEVYDEVPIAGRYADLVGVKGDEVVAVELKLNQWRTAFVQARAYQLGAQSAYVALPEPQALRLAPRIAPAFSPEGIGLLGIGSQGEVQELIAPVSSPRFLPFVSEAVIGAAQEPVPEFLLLPSQATILARIWESSS